MDWNAVFGAQDDSLESMLARQRVQNSAVFQIAQELQRRKETDRSFGLQEENTRENRAFRQQQQQSLDEDRANRAEDRANAQKTQDNQKFMNSLALRRKGDVVTPEEAVQFTRNNLTGSRVAAGADEHMAGPHFHFAGTAVQDDAEERQADADARQEEIDRHNRAMEAAALKSGSGSTGPRPRFSIQTTTDKNTGEQGLVRLNVDTGEVTPVDLGHDKIKGGQLPAAAQTQLTNYATVRGAIQSLKQMVDTSPNIASHLGPVAGLVADAKQKMPGLKADPEFARFKAISDTMKNSVIKAVTGAAMSEPEAQRILGQVPLETDKPEVWAQKAQATLENLDYIESSMKAAAGRGAPGAAPAQATGASAPAAPATPDLTKARERFKY